MASCGSVVKTLVAPAKGSALDTVVQEYLTVAKGFDADSMDGNGISALKVASGNLSGEQFTPLDRSIDALAQAKDLPAARVAFASVSAELIRVLENPAK
jgi:hypothetical protein